MPLLINLAIVLIVFIAFVLGVFFLMSRYKRIMLGVCGVFITIGFLIYTAVHLSAGEGYTNALFAALRGIFNTARMFTINKDIEMLAHAHGVSWLTESIFMQVVLWACHISALIIIQTALISIFGRRLVDKFRLRFGFHSEVYIIKGNDKNAVLLGENIATGDNPHSSVNPKRLIVFLTEDEDGMEKLRKMVNHFDGIVRLLDRVYDIEKHLKKARLGRSNWFWIKRTYRVILMQIDASAPDDAQRVSAFANDYGVKHDNLDIYVLAPSDWDKEKIEKITQAKDGQQRKYKYTFHIVSEIDLIIRQMIEKHPPFECPRLKLSDGKAANDFTVLIVGFDKVGQAALFRLIMNGQFVGSTMRAIVVDKDTSNIKDCFYHRYPGIGLSCKIDFHNFDAQCDQFYTLLKNTEEIDYVVVALSSDELNKKTAQNIELFFQRKGIDSIPIIAVSEKSGNLHFEDETEKTFIFGCREEIYKDAVIIREENDRRAKAINETYKSLYGGKEWHELDWFLQESNRAAADFIPAMLHLADPKLTIENAAEMSAIAEGELAETLAKTEHLRWNAFHAAMGYSPIGIEEMQQRFEMYNDLRLARQDSKYKLHACLTTWEQLDEVSAAYRDLARRAKDSKEEERDFKENDRKIVENIPKFLKKENERG